MSIQPQEKPLELVELAPEPELAEDVHHLGCCAWQLFAMKGQKHYALCGVELQGDPSDEEGLADCALCKELSRRVPYPCPMQTFGGDR
jgi:hypothetical protein